MKLFELNVINVDAIEKYATDLAKTIQNEAAKKWFINSVRRIMINDTQNNTRIAQVAPNAPEWQKQKYKQNVPLFRFTPSPELTDKLAHIVDWINSMDTYSKENVEPGTKKSQAKEQMIGYAKKMLSSLNQIDMNTLLSDKQKGKKHHVEDWFGFVNKMVDTTKPGEDENAGVKDEEKSKNVLEYDDGMYWTKIKSQRALDIEGKKMGHCVAGYYRQVANGETEILSLRDASGNPHATMEITGTDLQQVKGKGNKPPVYKYVPYVLDFLNKFKIIDAGDSSYAESDLMGMGLVFNKVDNKFESLLDSHKPEYNKDGFSIYEGGKEERKFYYVYQGKDVVAILRNSSRYRNANEKQHLRLDFNDPDDSELNSAIFAAVVDFLNHKFKEGYDMDNMEANNFYRVSEADKKFYSIDSMKPVYEFSNGMKAYKIFEEHYHSKKYNYIVMKDDERLLEFTTDDNTIGVSANGDASRDLINNDNKLIIELADFLNKQKVKFNPDNSYATNSLLRDTGLINKDGKFMSYLAGASIDKELSDKSKIFNFNNFYRFYSANNDELIAAWGISKYDGIDNLHIYSPIFRKYAKEFTDYMNSKESFTLRGRNNMAKSELAEYGISYRGGKFHVVKKRALETGWAIEKTSAKAANVVTAEGERAATLEFEKANFITKIRALKYPEELCQFLENYNVKHPDLSFSSGAAGQDMWKKYGYIIHDGKFVKLSEAMPTVEILKTKEGTWFKGPLFLSSDTPDNDKYGLKDSSGKVLMTLSISRRTHTYEDITIANGADNEDNDEKYDVVNMAPFIDSFSKLVQKEKLQISVPTLLQGGMTLKKGKIVAIDEKDDMLNGFVNGKITYDDGAEWKRQGSGVGRSWELIIPMKGADGEKENVRALICNISDTGINSIETRGPVSGKPKLYRKYLDNMLDIIERLNEENEGNE